MNFEEIENLTEERKIELLKDIVMNDAEYWRKIYLLMNMENENSELIDLIVNNKRAEIDMLDKQYKLNVNGFSFEELKNRDISKVMESMLSGNDLKEKYGKAYKEVLEVLKYIPEEYCKKVSPELISKIEDNADNNYEFMIDSGVKISEIQLLDETKDLLALISKKYWSVETKKKEVISNSEVESDSNIEIPVQNKLILNEKWYEKLFKKFRKSREVK